MPQPQKTRPYAAGEDRVSIDLGIPKAPRLPVTLLLVVVAPPVSACTPMPAGVIDVEGEPSTPWRRAS